MNSINSLAEGAKESLIAKACNSSPTTALLKWTLTNWVTVILAIITTAWVGRYYAQKLQLEKLLLERKVIELTKDLDKLQAERLELLSKIEELLSNLLDDKREIKKLKDSLSGLSTSELKERLIEYSNRLKIKRGLK